MAGGKVDSAILRALLVGLACWSAALHAQDSAQLSALRVGERLSDWLLRQPDDPQAYPPGLNWQVPSERDTQATLKRHLLVLLAISETAPPASRQRLVRVIEALPVTGRVRIPLADPRWLQAHPKEDPVLQFDHALTLPRRPDTVSVIAFDGRYCTLPHRFGSEARAYLSACQPQAIDRVDYAWVVQPDGTVRKFGIAQWNAQTQDEPAPGALLWAPARDSGWSPRFSALLAEFLSTQGIGTIASAAAVQRSDPASPSPVIPSAPARDAMITANDWGLIGLLQTPTARMAPSGEARFSYSRVSPYARSNFIFQPLDWLEAGFRYTDISNRAYGPAQLSGSQTYKDKSVDVKVRLTKETASLPQVALGVTDVGGNGLFSGEYLVASKRSGDFDWSLGIGWGYMGGRGNIRNPFSLISKSFDTRVGFDPSAQAGNVNTGSFFRGTTAFFGGVQYHTPWDKWLLKAEYDGNNYQREPQGNNQRYSSPINVGLVYRYSPGVDFAVGFERGNTLMLALTLHSPLDKLAMPKRSDEPMPQVVSSRPTNERPIWDRTAFDIGTLTRWSVRRISREGGELRVVIEGASGAYWNDRIERVAAVLHRDAPATINRFVLTFVEQGVPMTERVILREPWVAEHLRLQAASDRIEAVAATEPHAVLSGQSLWAPSQGRFGYAIVPSLQTNIGGPNGFLLFSAGVSAPMKLKLSESMSITGAANLRLVDNFGKFTYTAPSNLPRVRTYLREYMEASRVTLPNLQITQVGKLANDQYYTVYAGLLESMFAGAGGEWLYRPWHSPFAFGVDINRVQQRDFKQDFGFGNAGDQTRYRVTTGHASAYWDTGWKSTQVKLSIGQYLAGDIGGTLEISRTFNNGVSIGAWATKTNVSAAQFGEGSFDKAIYVKIPFDAMMTSRDASVANLVWSPLTRDGGARLNRSASLYSLTNPRGKRETSYGPPNSAVGTGLDNDGPERSLFADFGKTSLNLGRQVADGQMGNALWLGGGVVLASSLLDRPLANWANNHQSSRWNRLGKAATNMPLLLAAGTGMFWWGMGGDLASETAWSAIKSAALTLGAETILKIGVNRARPELDLGAAHFAPFKKGSANSSFPSIHMGAAFALVTPFAQQYDAPWLYALAGATAFGRIQQRQHFASDVVAGSLIGYGVGSLLLDQQHKKRGGPRITFGADRSIMSTWELE